MITLKARYALMSHVSSEQVEAVPVHILQHTFLWAQALHGKSLPLRTSSLVTQRRFATDAPSTDLKL